MTTKSMLDMSMYEINKTTHDAQFEILKRNYDKIKITKQQDINYTLMYINDFFRGALRYDKLISLNKEDIDFIDIFLYSHKYGNLMYDKNTININYKILPKNSGFTEEDLYKKIKQNYVLLFTNKEFILVTRSELKTKTVSICEKYIKNENEKV